MFWLPVNRNLMIMRKNHGWHGQLNVDGAVEHVVLHCSMVSVLLIKWALAD
jgi:hypothetical protein